MADNINAIVNDRIDELIKKLSGKVADDTKVTMMDNVLAFTSLSGGNGASFIVSNVAHLLAEKHKLQVLVIDLNILFPIQYMYFNKKVVKNKPDLVSYLLGKNEVGLSMETKGNITTLFSNNRHLLDHINCDTELSATNFSELIDKIKYLFDVILLDVPLELNHDLVNMALFKSDTIYTVWSESLSTITNANRFIGNLNTTGIDTSKIYTIFNKRTSIHYSQSTFKDLGYNLISVIPFDTSVIETSLKGKIYCDKGESISKNAQLIVHRLEQLTVDILKIGGYKTPRELSKLAKQKVKQETEEQQ